MDDPRTPHELEERPTTAAPPVADAGLEPNVAGALSYLLGALTGVLFLVIDGQRPFVRFHAMQAIIVTVAAVVLSVALGIVGTVLAFIPILGWLVGFLLSIAFSGAALILWLYLMYRAWQGDEWEVPIAGRYARQLADQA